MDRDIDYPVLANSKGTEPLGPRQIIVSLARDFVERMKQAAYSFVMQKSAKERISSRS